MHVDDFYSSLMINLYIKKKVAGHFPIVNVSYKLMSVVPFMASFIRPPSFSNLNLSAVKSFLL